MAGEVGGDYPNYEQWMRHFAGRTDEEETATFREQAETVMRQLLAEEFTASDEEQPLTQAQSEVRTRLVHSLLRDIFDLKARARRGCVRGSGLSPDRDSEWCFPLEGSDNQLGELRHPVLVDGEGTTEFFGWQFRMYFAAPLVEPALILYLVFGRKPSGSLGDGWRAIQREHINQARGEFSAWRASRQLGNSLPPGVG